MVLTDGSGKTVNWNDFTPGDLHSEIHAQLKHLAKIWGEAYGRRSRITHVTVPSDDPEESCELSLVHDSGGRGWIFQLRYGDTMRPQSTKLMADCKFEEIQKLVPLLEDLRGELRANHLRHDEECKPYRKVLVELQRLKEVR